MVVMMLTDVASTVNINAMQKSKRKMSGKNRE
jgi:hypothetical protein